MRFYDREKEITLLRQIENQSKSAATFTVLMGRRRVGKTSLIMHTLQGNDFSYLFVSKDNEAWLCQKFQTVLEQQLALPVYGSITRFRDLFEVIMRESQRRHFTLVIDEFQNLYRINPALFSEMQDLWDRYHTSSYINLIAMGSMQSLMKRIFENHNEPLYGRPTSKWTLRPFTIDVLKQILRDYAPDYTNEDLLCLYMLTGGVAKYVELLMDAGCLTKNDMIDYVCRQDSYFLTEGRDLINNEFGSEYNTYYSILQLIATGKTHRAEIDGALQKDTGTFLQNLEHNFAMIRRLRPILAERSSKTSSYEIVDPFLRFWFRFICPYQALVESGQLDLLKQNILTHYDRFSGITLERYFQQQLMETGHFTQVGNWWDRKGETELDIVAVNEFDHTGVVAEVKRQKHKINTQQLADKVAQLPPKAFSSYSLKMQAYSIKDM